MAQRRGRLNSLAPTVIGTKAKRGHLAQRPDGQRRAGHNGPAPTTMAQWQSAATQRQQPEANGLEVYVRDVRDFLGLVLEEPASQAGLVPPVTSPMTQPAKLRTPESTRLPSQRCRPPSPPCNCGRASAKDGGQQRQK